MNACNGRSSVCTESVHSTVCHCACVAQIITVGSGAHVQAVGRLSEHHPVFRALDVLASKCRIHVLQTTLKMTVSCLDAYPIIHAALQIAVVSCSTHQQLFKQQLAPWSVTDEAFTSGPRPKQHNNEDATSAYAAREGMCRTLSCCQFHMLRSSKFGHVQGCPSFVTW